MKADGSLVSLIQGVSQQPSRTRLAGQCTLQENCSSNVVRGLSRRNALKYLASVANDPGVTYWQDFIAADGELYWAAMGASHFRLFDKNLVEKSVTVNDPSYISGGEMSFESIDDLTYVVNPTRKVTMLGDVPTYSRGGALVWLLGGQYGRVYRLSVRFYDASAVYQTVTVTFTTPNGGTVSDITQVATEYIATQLETALNANATFTTTMNVARSSDVLYIRFDDPLRGTAGTDIIDVTVDDGDGGANIFCIHSGTQNNTNAPINKTKDTGHLPRYAPHRFVVKVTGDGRASEDDFYLQFLVRDQVGSAALGTAFGYDGVWRECTAPDEPHKWDLSTMPHVLQKQIDGTWIFAQANWRDREAGDDNTNPPPSFLSRTLNDCATFQGRLAFVSGNSAIMSRTDKHIDFWKQSALVDAPDDPIDVMSTAKSFSVMRRIEAHNRDLVVFSDKAQFVIFGRNALTPSNAALVLTTGFECALDASPVTAGRNVFFAINNGKYTGIKEFYTESTEDINDSRPITQHVSKYILGKVRHIASSSNFNTMAVLAGGDKKHMYVYEYLWVDQEKVQASWSTWTSPYEIVRVTFEQEYMHILLKRPTGMIDALVMELEALEDTGLSFQVHLDYKVTIPSSGTSATIPFTVDEANMHVVVVQGDGCPYPGLRAEHTRNGSDITLTNDLNNGDLIVGVSYLSRYIPTMPVVKDANRVKVGTGRLTVRRFLMQHDLTGYIKALIKSKFREVRELYFSGRIVGSPDNLVGVPAITTGTFVVPFRTNTDYGEIEVQSADYTPFTLLDIEWQGQYTKRGKRILGGDG